VELLGEEEARGMEPDGEQVAAEDMKEHVHLVTLSSWVSCLKVGAKGRRIGPVRERGPRVSLMRDID